MNVLNFFPVNHHQAFDIHCLNVYVNQLLSVDYYYRINHSMRMLLDVDFFLVELEWGRSTSHLTNVFLLYNQRQSTNELDIHVYNMVHCLRQHRIFKIKWKCRSREVDVFLGIKTYGTKQTRFSFKQSTRSLGLFHWWIFEQQLNDSVSVGMFRAVCRFKQN